MHPQETEVCCDDHDKVSLCLAALMNMKSKHDPLSQYHQQDKVLWLLTQDVEKYGISCLYKKRFSTTLDDSENVLFFWKDPTLFCNNQHNKT